MELYELRCKVNICIITWIEMSSKDPYNLDSIEEEYQQEKVLSEQDELEVRVTSANVYKVDGTYEIVIYFSALNYLEYIGIITVNGVLTNFDQMANSSTAPKWIQKLDDLFFQLGAGKIDDNLQKLINRTTSLSTCEDGLDELYLDGNDLTLTRIDHAENPTVHTVWGKKQPNTRYETLEGRDRLPPRLMTSTRIYDKCKYLSEGVHKADIRIAAVIYNQVRIIISPINRVNYVIKLDFNQENINKLVTIFNIAGVGFSRDLSKLVGKSIPVSSDNSVTQMYVDTDKWSIEANFFCSGNVQMSASDSQIPTSAERIIRYNKKPGPAEVNIADIDIINKETGEKILKVNIDLFGQTETFEMTADPSNDRFSDFVETVGYGSVNQATDGEVYVLRFRDSIRNQEGEELIQQFQDDIYDTISDEFSLWCIVLSEKTATSINNQIKRKYETGSFDIRRVFGLIMLSLVILLVVVIFIRYT